MPNDSNVNQHPPAPLVRYAVTVHRDHVNRERADIHVLAPSPRAAVEAARSQAVQDVIDHLFFDDDGRVDRDSYAFTVHEPSGDLVLAVDGLQDTPPPSAPSAIDALRAVLLFYVPVGWSDEQRAEWLRLTGGSEATTRALADFVRTAIARAAGEPLP